MRRKVPKVESILAQIAWGQHGNVTRRQLLGKGLGPSAVDRRVRRGDLIPQYPGVYRVGHQAPSIEAEYAAAVLACGDGDALSGTAAGWLLELKRGRTAPPPEVTTRKERRIQGLRTRTRRLGPRETTIWRGIRVTTVARTLVDLAEVLSLDALSLACHEAGVKYGTTPRRVEDVLARHPNAPGAAKLRVVLRGDSPAVLSRLERAFRRLVRERGWPRPQMNRPAGSKRVDCRWPQYKLTIELDSFTFHNSRHSWEQDRKREREAHARGDAFRRYTSFDVLEVPEPMLEEVLKLLRAGGFTG